MENIDWGTNTYPRQGPHAGSTSSSTGVARSRKASNWTLEVRFGVDLVLRRPGTGSGSFGFTN